MLSLHSLASEIIDVPFTADSKKHYRTTHLLKDLKINDQMLLQTAYVLLVETPSLHDAPYETQNGELEKFGHLAETYQVLFVVASPEDAYQHGYRTSTETAKKLLGEDARFRVRLLNSEGMVLHESLRPVKVTALQKWLGQ